MQNPTLNGFYKGQDRTYMTLYYFSNGKLQMSFTRFKTYYPDKSIVLDYSGQQFNPQTNLFEPLPQETTIEYLDKYYSSAPVLQR